MEAINDSSKLVAQAIDILKEEATQESIQKVIELLKTALDKLVMEIG